jgi:hypothetical protein
MRPHSHLEESDMSIWLIIIAAVGAGIAATSFGINYQFAGRSFKLFLIDGGYHTVQFALYGAIYAGLHEIL